MVITTAHVAINTAISCIVSVPLSTIPETATKTDTGNSIENKNIVNS